MLTFLQKYFQVLCLLLVVLLGISLGHLAATSLGVYLSPASAISNAQAKALPAPARKASLSEFGIILQRDIFDSSAHNSASLAPLKSQEKATSTAPAPRTDLTLLGTVVAGDDSLAVIAANRKIDTYRLKDEVPGGGHLEKVERVRVTIKNADGSEGNLFLFEKDRKQSKATGGPTASRAAPAPSARSAGVTGQGIRSLGGNRFVIPRDEAEKARGNLNQLLSQARMVPNMVNGKTDGFMVKMVQPRSFIAMLGLKPGDIVRQVNGVDLNSPEQALQIFQQLREARHITIGLERNGKPESFEYEVN